MSQFMDQILISRSLKQTSGLDLKATNLEHRQILEKIRDGNSKEIKSIVRAHIQRGLDDLVRLAS